MDISSLLSEVETSYYNYLSTTFYIRDKELRESFAASLAKETLSRGPFLESTPQFGKGASLRTLLAELYPDEHWDDSFLQAVRSDQALYSHQEHAIRSTARGDGVVVATGTGSGKTEAFLLPILVHLYRQWKQSPHKQPGIRALLLYPMNALVADQRDRLGEIAQVLQRNPSGFQFTFGQYIGATPEDVPPQDGGYPGELLTRVQMQANPPDILITNYSMLEYLLIRPNDSELFDHGRSAFWRFLVLDEAHQYRGAKGIEMAMLMRRLKDRLRVGGRQEPFTCIATSATLGEPSLESKSIVATFASSLFDEPFSIDQVTFGDPRPPSAAGTRPVDWQSYHNYLEEMESGRCTATDLALLLHDDANFARLVATLAEGPQPLTALAAQVFPMVHDPSDREGALVRLVDCALAAAPSPDAPPLLSVRYHFLLRALQGVRVTLGRVPRVHLTGRATPTTGYPFELALCRYCGQHYLAGRIINNQFLPPITDPTHDDYHQVFFLPASGTDQEDLEGTSNNREWVCARCGKAGERDTCDHQARVQLFRVEADKREQFTCLVCQQSGEDVIRELFHGSDAPHAVIVTALHAQLPPARRRILAFADSRQRAAFFAWYVSDSYHTIVERNRIWRTVTTISHQGDDASLEDTALGVAGLLRSEGVMPESSSRTTIQRHGWTAALKEVLATSDAHSLEATGLLIGRIQLPRWWTVPEEIGSQHHLTADLVRETMRWILHSLVAQKAVALPEATPEVEWSEISHGSDSKVFVLGKPGSAAKAVALDGRLSNRVRVLARTLASTAGTPTRWRAHLDQAAELTRALLEHTLALQKHQDLREDWLVDQKPGGYAVNLAWWRWTAIDDPSVSSLRQCPSCHRVTSWTLADVCPTWACQGTLRPLDGSILEENHYRTLYLKSLPGSLRAEEHTAQLSREKALDFQNAFKRGAINVLSSSTTFEVGVDLGELDVILLRNVPPEKYNYAQRVGRAGRRRGFPGVAVTYCNRAPHDLYHFEHPEGMISGHSRPPVIQIENEVIVRRHWAAVVLSEYFRHGHGERFGSVRDFLGGQMDDPTVRDSLTHFIGQDPMRWQEAFERIVPPNLRMSNTTLNDWMNDFLDLDGPLSLSIAQVVGEWKQAKAYEERSRDDANYRNAEWAQRRGKQISSQNLIGFLSRNVVIPKYGFPVDLVELELLSDVPEASEVVLQRDLSQAISEFAPSARVVANKKLWTSAAVKRGPQGVWRQGRYRTCKAHGTLDWVDNIGMFAGGPCCASARERNYLIPEWGFTTDRSRPSDLRARPGRLFSSRPYFAEAADPAGWTRTLRLPTEDPRLTAYDVRPGTIVMVSEGQRGQGFSICAECGAADAKPIHSPHKTPFGGQCLAHPLPRTALAHQFRTHVLRLDLRSDALPSAALAYGLAYALQLGAAEVLEVPLTDLQALVFEIDPLSVLLVDNVPGGAGLVSQLVSHNVLLDVLTAATARLSGNCGCDDNSSCYGCLKTYGNQFIHHELSRGPVFQFLTSLRGTLS